MAIAIGPNFDWSAYARNGNSTTPQPGSQAWQQNMQQQIQQQLSAIPMPQMPQFQPLPAFQAAVQPAQPSAPTQPTAQQLQQQLSFMQQNPNFLGVSPERIAALQQQLSGMQGGGASGGGAAAASPVAGEDPRLTAILAQLQGQAALNDSVLTDQAAQGVAAQRAVMQRQLEKSLTGSLSSRGLLPGGGNVAKLRQELEAPMQEQLAAQQERIRQDLVGRRDATSNNLAAQLADLQRQKSAGESDKARLALEQQRAQQQMQIEQQRLAQEQARFTWEAQNAAQQNAYNQAMAQYRMQQTAMESQLRQQAAQQGYNSDAGYNASAAAPRGGGGVGSLAGTGYNDTSWFNLNPGSTSGIGAQRDAAARQRFEQNQANSAPSGAAQAARAASPSYQWQGNTGNGMSSAGSATGISMNGPMVGSSVNYGGSGAGQGGYGGYPVYGGAYQAALGAANYAAGAAGSGFNY